MNYAQRQPAECKKDERCVQNWRHGLTGLDKHTVTGGRTKAHLEWAEENWDVATLNYLNNSFEKFFCEG